MINFFRSGLKPIANIVSRDEAIYNQTAAMITEKHLLSLKSLKDLQNLTACFAGYRDAGKNKVINNFALNFFRFYKFLHNKYLFKDGMLLSS